jgi:uncharacterized membrane protein YoaK (UPF0700 family)
VSAQLIDAWRTIVPRKDDPHGPLPPLLVSLTVVTGLVDAFSYLTLGHVFVANMTGNVVFLAFALAGANGFSAIASLLALGSFAVGSLIGGRLHVVLAAHRGRLLAVATALQVVLVVAAIVVRLASGSHGSTIAHDVLIFLLASTMGLQNAAVRSLAVPDLTTTVLTLTTTAMFADSRVVGGSGSKAGRRVVSILAMFIGALVGAVLVLHASSALTLLAVLVLLVGVALAAGLLSRHRASWSVSESP